MSSEQTWGMSDIKEEKGKVYRPRITTAIVLGFAIVNLFIGMVLLVFGIIVVIKAENILVLGISAVYFIPAGFAQILFSCLLYIIGALSKDVYEMVYFLDYAKAQNDRYYYSMVKHMQQMERNQEAIKSGIAVISSKMENKNERTEIRRVNRDIQMGE